MRNKGFVFFAAVALSAAMFALFSCVGGGPTDGTAADCTDDSFEANDALADARSIAGTKSGTKYSNLVLCAGDEDWYKIGLDAGQSLTVSIGFTDADGNLDLYLDDSAGAVLASSKGTTDGETTTLASASKAGTYYIRVVGAAATDANEYTMTVTYDATSPCLQYLDSYIIASLDGAACCNCGDAGCDVSSPTFSCCWGDGDWGLLVTLGAGGISGDKADIEIALTSDPYNDSPSYPVVFMHGTLTCSTGAFTATSSYCEKMDGSLATLTGTLTVLDFTDNSSVPWTCAATTTCTSNWDGTPTDLEVCSVSGECRLCEPLSEPGPIKRRLEIRQDGGFHKKPVPR